ncbi:MAG: ATP-binding protein [Ruminococcus sp.]|nr:ATP-binding protein [Ruminococcus sp.]
MAALYGPNGSGKTNYLKGLWKLRSLVLEAPHVSLKNCTFLFDEESKQAPTEFDVLFRILDREYEYQLKITETQVVEENLFGRDLSAGEFDVLFDRDSEGVYLCEAWENTDVSTLTDEMPLLYFLGQNQQEEELQSVIQFFEKMVYVSGDALEQEALVEVLQSPELKEQLCSHLKNVGTSVADIQMDGDQIVVTHEKNKMVVAFAWEEESSGIQHMICLLAELLTARKEGKLVLADAPEVQLHPKSMKYLYQLAADTASSTACAQFLTATHENSNMNNSVFRRDELWLVGPQQDGSSTLYVLALFLKENGEKVRKDETYFKQYLEGRYGADPVILR